MKKYSAEIWVVADDDMPEKVVIENIRKCVAECWGGDGHFKLSRICNIKSVAETEVEAYSEALAKMIDVEPEITATEITP